MSETKKVRVAIIGVGNCASSSVQGVNYYKDTFQHGGVSLEEVLIPLITMSPKNV